MRLAILDRDGTINRESDDYIKGPAEWEPLAGSLEAIGRLNRGGWRVVVASNQSGLGRGMFTPTDLFGIQEKMNRLLQSHGGHVEGFFFCPHHPDDSCPCRKPETGLLREISQRFHTSLAGVPVIGDSERDMKAALATGARPMLVLTGRGMAARRELEAQGELDQVEVHEDLAAAANILLAEYGEADPAGDSH